MLRKGKKTVAMLLAAAVMSTGATTSITLIESGTVAFAASTVTVDVSNPSGDGVSVEKTDTETIITIESDGTYKLTGSATNTCVTIKKGVTAKLILNSVTLDNSSYTGTAIESVIDAKASSNVSIELNGTSYIKCNSTNSSMENAIRHNKTAGTALSFSGSGTLNISGTYDDGIKYKNGTVQIIGGTINITDCYGDGIQAENVDITGGTTNITTAFANASTGYYTSGSSSTTLNTITENGDTKVEVVNVDTGSHTGIKVGKKEKTYSYTAVLDEDSEDYTAGTTYSDEASGTFTMSGGTLNIDTTATGLKSNNLTSSGYTATASGVYIVGSPDDGIHSNNDMSVTGGTINIASSDDGISVANTLNITGNSTNVDITEAYEGIEAASVVVGNGSTSPEVTIYSNDDGINAASKTSAYVYADTSEEKYTKTTTAKSGNTLTVNSGSVNIYIDSENAKTATLSGKSVSYKASGDGMDANGSIAINGGKVYVFGQSTGDNSPLDSDTGMTIADGATVLAVGCDAMNESVPASGQYYITYTGSETTATAQAAGSQTTGFGGGMMPTDGTMPGGGNMPTDGTMPGGGTAPTDGNAPTMPDGTMPNGGGNDGGNMPGFNTASTISAGSVFTVLDSDGNALVSETLPYAASFVMYSSPKIVSGGTYTFSSEKTTVSDEANTDDSKTTDESAKDASTTEETSATDGTSSSTTKKSQTISVKVNGTKVSGTKTVKLSKAALKKAKKTITVKATTSGDGKVTYSLSGSSKFSINKNTGKITVKKGSYTKGKTYTLKVKVNAAATSTSKKTTKTIKIKVKIKK